MGDKGPIVSFKAREYATMTTRIKDLEAEMERHAMALNDLLEDKYNTRNKGSIGRPYSGSHQGEPGAHG